MKSVYLDYAATTPLEPRVLEAMMPYLVSEYGNASSVHSFGQRARKGVERARRQVADVLACDPHEVIFTGSGTEADNLAIMGVAESYAKERGRHIITTSVEHHAVSETFEALKERGFEVTFLPVDSYGRLNLDQLAQAITPETSLVSVIHGNNEIGTLQPAAAIGELCRSKGVLFHLDAVQTVGQLRVKVPELQCDLLSLAAHKFYGPKGVGALYLKRGVRLKPQIHGGAQERGIRAGTENVPAIVGLGAAIALAEEEREESYHRELALRDRLINGLLQLPDVLLNGHPIERLPNNCNVSILWVEGESILLALDLQGVAASSGSACTSGSLEPSHVLLGLGLDHSTAHGSLRLTVGKETSDADIDYVLEVLPPIIDRLRRLSPIWPGPR